ncbi:MAG: PfkB family carbohydrate kinase [Lachnospiraceae bacterium]
METQSLLSLAERMKNADPTKIKATVGFDGFVDEVIHVVDKRVDQEHYERVKYLKDYGQKIIDASGLSLNIEMIPVDRKLGGNGTIFANSLIKHGMKVNYIGALGKHQIHEVFREMEEKAQLFSFSDPGFTDAIEFYDGKIISSKLEPLKDVNWKNLKSVISVEKLAKLFDESELISFANWTLIINATEIWKGIYSEVLPLMESDSRKKLFIDLADPEKRSEEDIREALDVLKKYNTKFEVILGLNAKESYEIIELFGKKKEEFSEIESITVFLQKKLGISAVVIHPVKEAAACSTEGAFRVDGPYCKQPKLTTGAGDNFNAGFMLGQMLGFGMEESLLMGTANSGFYVRNARSCNYQELIAFIVDWAKGKVF